MKNINKIIVKVELKVLKLGLSRKKRIYFTKYTAKLMNDIAFNKIKENLNSLLIEVSGNNNKLKINGITNKGTAAYQERGSSSMFATGFEVTIKII